MADCSFYAVYMNDEVHYYSAFDIVCLIELGVLGTLDYCFCFQKNKWQKIDSDPYIINGLNPKFYSIKESKLKDSLAGPPKVIPDDPHGKVVYSLVDKFLKYHSDIPSEEGGESELHHMKKMVDKLQGEIKNFKQREAQSKKYIHHLLNEKAKPNEQGIYGWEELIGEVFEIIDTPEWYLKREGKALGPYTFSYLYGLYKNEDIGRKALIKKEGDRVFNRIGEVYEFNTKVFTRVEKIDGETLSRYFVRRADFRIPFYEVVEISFGDHKWKGHCTNLSIGGGFIEFGSLPKELAMNAVVRFKLNSNTLNQTIEAQAIIKNIQSERSAGVGCAFLDLSPEDKKTIADYVESFLAQEESKAS